MSNVYDPKANRSKHIFTPGTSHKNPEFAKSDLSRILPRQTSTGSTRGVQTIGYGNVKLNGPQNNITIGGTGVAVDQSVILGQYTIGGTTGVGLAVTNSDGSVVGLGRIPGTDEFGFFATDADGTLVMKVVDGTQYTYNADSGNNVTQLGKLTNGDYGAAFAKDGDDLVEALGE